LADSQYSHCRSHIERYQSKVPTKAYTIMKAFEEELEKHGKKKKGISSLLEECNAKIADMVKKETEDVLDKVLYEVSCQMKNGYGRSDA